MMRRQDHHYQHHNQAQQQSRVFYELSSMILNILRSPPTAALHFSDLSQATTPLPPSPPPMRRDRLPQQITPAGFASLMLGISLTLMLCGSVTFFIGFMLLPWVIGLVMVFYVVGLVSSLSLLGRTVLYYATSPPSSPSSPRKDIPERSGLVPFLFGCRTSISSYFK